MHLYLVQHGIALSKDQNSERALSDVGVDELNKVRAFLESNVSPRVASIYHSGKLRARQTADILAEAVHSDGGVEEAEGLNPMDEPAIWAKKLGRMHEDVMLVGHLPHLARLAGLLLTGDPDRQPVYVRNGGIVCLLRDPDTVWTVDWVIAPDMLR